jgi:bifunctional non-homologous end joining protein LigD
MLASTTAAPLDSADYVYEPKYDGIRALVSVESSAVHIWSRLGNEKTSQFPEIVSALRTAAATIGRPVVLDGEIVALGPDGEPAGFQYLQGRIHLKTGAGDAPVALVVFDVLRDGREDLRPLPLRVRRARLEQIVAGLTGHILRISDQVSGDGRALYQHAQHQGWEGLVAKRADAPYRTGKRSPEWSKLKLVRQQTCVVAGWTEPRGSRPFFGALLLGVYDDAQRLHYIGHSGAGFADAELGRVWKRVHALETRECPFAKVPRTNERAHWAKPRLVAEVKFTEWTADGKLRHPTYLGLRDDVDPERVRKEPDPAVPGPHPPDDATSPRGRMKPARPRTPAQKPVTRGSSHAPARERKRASPALTAASMRKLFAQIDAIQERGGSGVLELPGGDTIEVSNLGKMFWPKMKLTKGDLLRHYVRVAPLILPVLADRPLVMKRFPNGVGAKPFYQHRAPDKVPAGVRVDSVTSDVERRAHVIGGDLKTLLYTAQLASISQDPWFSRVGSEDQTDHIAIDLDPPDGLPFSKVLDVARWVRDELAALGATGFAKTSGAGGVHIYVPMPKGTPYEAGLIYAQIVATVVAGKHAKVATIERSLAARGRRIYVDYLQNSRGKTLASAYSARASEFAGVSTPLSWDEVEEGVSPQDFTVKNFAARIDQAGDLWSALRKAKPADLRAVDQLTR